MSEENEFTIAKASASRASWAVAVGVITVVGVFLLALFGGGIISAPSPIAPPAPVRAAVVADSPKPAHELTDEERAAGDAVDAIEKNEKRGGEIDVKESTIVEHSGTAWFVDVVATRKRDRAVESYCVMLILGEGGRYQIGRDGVEICSDPPTANETYFMKCINHWPDFACNQGAEK